MHPYISFLRWRLLCSPHASNVLSLFRWSTHRRRSFNEEREKEWTHLFFRAWDAICSENGLCDCFVSHLSFSFSCFTISTPFAHNIIYRNKNQFSANDTISYLLIFVNHEKLVWMNSLQKSNRTIHPPHRKTLVQHRFSSDVFHMDMTTDTSYPTSMQLSFDLDSSQSIVHQ